MHWPKSRTISRSRSISRSPLHRLPRINAAVYFICAEALTNTAKHAAASHATVRVRSDR